MVAHVTELVTELVTGLHGAGGDPPEAIFFACKDGSIRCATMDKAFEPCDGCDCGWFEIGLLALENLDG